jgi:hypothetical protein
MDGDGKFGVFRYLLTDTEKSRQGIMPGEYIEHFECIFWRRSIIDGQPDLPIFGSKSSNHLSVQRTISKKGRDQQDGSATNRENAACRGSSSQTCLNRPKS